jgi:hypothetical protein
MNLVEAPWPWRACQRGKGGGGKRGEGGEQLHVGWGARRGQHVEERPAVHGVAACCFLCAYRSSCVRKKRRRRERKEKEEREGKKENGEISEI